MFTLRKKSKQSGFTLMELLIVIAILGLLLGLIAPRLGGITASTADNVCDTNNKGIRGMTALFLETNGTLPSGLTNMVEYSAADTAVLASIQNAATPYDADAGTGEEVISAAFAGRNYPGLYEISQAEFQDLAALGVTTVHNLVGWDATAATPAARAMHEGNLAAGSPVMMLGVGGGDTPALVDINSADYFDAMPGATSTFGADGTIAGNPSWWGRIAMAVNDKCDLVTSGLITASALCPTAVLAEGLFSHEEFFIILPRLQGTVDRADMIALAGTIANTSWVAATEGGTAIANGELVEVAYLEAQEAWQFEVACPEGHKWPAPDAEAWIPLP